MEPINALGPVRTGWAAPGTPSRLPRRPDPTWRPAASIAGVLIFASALLVATGCGAARAEEQEAEAIARLLRVEPGSHVADVGAGDGEWALDLARRVGPDGRLWATEIESADVEDLREVFEDAGLSQAEALLGGATETGLPDESCDAILLRLVYHHFTDPGPMRAALARALRPGGRLLVIDIRPQTQWRDLDGVPDRGGHGIEPDRLIAEMTDDGWTVVERRDEFGDDPEHFAVLFVESEPGER